MADIRNGSIAVDKWEENHSFRDDDTRTSDPRSWNSGGQNRIFLDTELFLGETANRAILARKLKTHYAAVS